MIVKLAQRVDGSLSFGEFRHVLFEKSRLLTVVGKSSRLKVICCVKMIELRESFDCNISVSPSKQASERQPDRPGSTSMLRDQQSQKKFGRNWWEKNHYCLTVGSS